VALAMAAWLAQYYGAELHVLHVEDPLLDAAANYAGFDLVRETHAQLLRFIAEAWPAVEAAQSYVISGTTVDVILDVARDAHADLVVVGSCGLNRAERLVFDSMPDTLLKRAEVSVLVAAADSPLRWHERN
jgi:nucleotide-binding universal stress UspA family protein